jgi:hypothetical protein
LTDIFYTGNVVLHRLDFRAWDHQCPRRRGNDDTGAT